MGIVSGNFYVADMTLGEGYPEERHKPTGLLLRNLH